MILLSIKIDRLEMIFSKEISNILQTEIKDENIKFVTVTGAKISSDLSYAKVFVTVLDDSKKDKTMIALNKASRFIRKTLCDKIEIRKMPEIKFIYDDSINYGRKIEKIIKELE